MPHISAFSVDTATIAIRPVIVKPKFWFGVVPYDVVDAVASNELDDYEDDDVDVVTFITYIRTTSY